MLWTNLVSSSSFERLAGIAGISQQELSANWTSVSHVLQFSGESAERMKKTYGKFCGHHNEAVNNFKDLYSKDKRFQAFVKVGTGRTDIVDGKSMSFLHSDEHFATELEFSSLFLRKK